MTYGYARCSTDESRQDINRQKRELKELGCTDETNMYWEYESGTKADRIELNKLLNVVKAGDTIVTTEVSRITRSTKQLCEIIELAQEKHLKLIIGAFVVDCSKGELDPMTEGMLKMMGVFAEMERNMISQRVKSGMANAKAKGKVVGRPTTTIDNLPTLFIKHYPKYKSGEVNKSELARLCDMTRQSIIKYIKIYEGTQEQPAEQDTIKDNNNNIKDTKKKSNKEIIKSEVSKLGYELSSYDTLINKLSKKELSKVLEVLNEEYTDVDVVINKKEYVVEISTVDDEKDLIVLTKAEYIDRYSDVRYCE